MSHSVVGAVPSAARPAAATEPGGTGATDATGRFAALAQRLPRNMNWFWMSVLVGEEEQATIHSTRHRGQRWAVGDAPAQQAMAERMGRDPVIGRDAARVHLAAIGGERTDATVLVV